MTGKPNVDNVPISFFRRSGIRSIPEFLGWLVIVCFFVGLFGFQAPISPQYFPGCTHGLIIREMFRR